MLANYQKGTQAYSPTRQSLDGWKVYSMTESNESIWCKVGYVGRAPGKPVYALEIATIRQPSKSERDGFSPTAAEREAACDELPAIATVIDSGLPY